MPAPPQNSPAAPRVRRARPADVAAAGALAAELVRFHHQLDPARFAMLADPLEPGYTRFLRARLDDPDAIVLVACGASDDAVIGYAYGQSEPASWPDLLDASGRFHDLYVAPGNRGGGVGAALARAMLAEFAAQGAARVVLATAWLNPAARRLFEALGFRPTMVEMTRNAAERGAMERR